MFLDVPAKLSTTFSGQELTLESGLLARQATASVVGTLGKTTIMANVVVGKKTDYDYFPLQVIFEEKLYASGKIHGSRFIKREGRPSENAILTGRMIDRSLRSLFDDNIRSEIQVVVTALSIDEVNQPDTLAVLVASTALKMATDEFLGPVACTRIGLQINDKTPIVEELLNNLDLATSFEDIQPNLAKISELLDSKNGEETLVRDVAKKINQKNSDWVKEFSRLYNSTKKLNPAQLLEKYPVLANYLINPTYNEQTTSLLDLAVSGTKNSIVMVEAGSQILPEKFINQGFELCLPAFEALNSFQGEFLDLAKSLNLCQNVALEKKTIEPKYTHYWESHLPEIEAILYSRLPKTEKDKELKNYTNLHLNHLALLQKLKIDNNLGTIEDLRTFLITHDSDTLNAQHSQILDNKDFNLSISQTILGFLENLTEKDKLESVKNYLLEGFSKQVKEMVKEKILEEERRIDGRHLDEIRKITCQVDVLPCVHGSSLFSRGETQVLNVLTLGTLRDAQLLDDMEDFEENKKRYIHHYNFPPYSVGETGRYGAPGRREIGHGALAEKALLPVLPKEEVFPYTIRLVSECLGSNGSTSMASTCSSSLSLMTAGVPISAPVAGIAMGLVMVEGGANYKILTDIQGLEDHYGEMDFKVTGTKEGITAIQLDNKVAGLTPRILVEALEKSRIARNQILDKMIHLISEPKASISATAPGVEIIDIPADRIGEIIGPSGKNIKAIISKYQVEIDIDDVSGKTFIYSKNKTNSEQAKAYILANFKEYQRGESVLGKVFRIEAYGAFVKLLDEGGNETAKEGLIHISAISKARIKDVNDYVKLGDTLDCKVLEINEKGQISLELTTRFESLEAKA